MEIAFKLNSSGDWYRGKHANICAGQLRREVALPKGEPKFYAVFTKKKVADSFRIQAPYHVNCWGMLSNLDGLRRTVELMAKPKSILAKAYKKGFRYVRIEY